MSTRGHTGENPRYEASRFDQRGRSITLLVLSLNNVTSISILPRNSCTSVRSDFFDRTIARVCFFGHPLSEGFRECPTQIVRFGVIRIRFERVVIRL